MSQVVVLDGSSFFGAVKPLLLSLKLSGADLYPKEARGKLSLFYSISLLVLSYASFIYLGVVTWNNSAKRSQTSSTTDAIIANLQSYGNNAMLLCAHLVFLLCSRQKINEFWNIISHLGKRLNFGENYCKNLRRNSIIATVVSTIMDAGIVIWLLRPWLDKAKLIGQTAKVIVYLSSCGIALKACLLYIVCGLAIADIYAEINQTLVEELKQQTKPKLALWIGCHRDASDATRILTEINQVPMMCVTLSTFLFAIIRIFKIAVMTSGPDMDNANTIRVVWYLVDFVQVLVVFWLSCYMADVVTREAKHTAQILCNENMEGDNVDRLYSDPFSKMNFYIAKVTTSVPTFEIMGLFQLSQHLITTLAGTTLTYFVILWQIKEA